MLLQNYKYTKEHKGPKDKNMKQTTSVQKMNTPKSSTTIQMNSNTKYRVPGTPYNLTSDSPGPLHLIKITRSTGIARINRFSGIIRFIQQQHIS